MEGIVLAITMVKHQPAKRGGEYVMTEHDCRGKVVAEDSVGLASYTMDSHHTQRVLVENNAKGHSDSFAPIAIAASARSRRP